MRRLWCRLVGHDMRHPKLYGARRINRCQRCGIEENIGPQFDEPGAMTVAEIRKAEDT